MPTHFDIGKEVSLIEIINLPGEGFVAELRIENASYMFDRRGLQHLIIEKQKIGLNASVEEYALARINNFSSAFGER
ncbi:MAG: hypothetical protein OXE41_03670 [Gammaproteobacteria bacterium]|nr:hypothetical protein [Gammaproteobacteria bacterium]MCY4218865.1 hypothetical protein [Gammaproteobacteria bacterium]MCY4274485.1 hypothetical protein [Gammaproteobacteria bacterium]